MKENRWRVIVSAANELTGWADLHEIVVHTNISMEWKWADAICREPEPIPLCSPNAIDTSLPMARIYNFYNWMCKQHREQNREKNAPAIRHAIISFPLAGSTIPSESLWSPYTCNVHIIPSILLTIPKQNIWSTQPDADIVRNTMDGRGHAWVLDDLCVWICATRKDVSYYRTHQTRSSSNLTGMNVCV